MVWFGFLGLVLQFICSGNWVFALHFSAVWILLVAPPWSFVLFISCRLEFGSRSMIRFRFEFRFLIFEEGEQGNVHCT